MIRIIPTIGVIIIVLQLYLIYLGHSFYFSQQDQHQHQNQNGARHEQLSHPQSPVALALQNSKGNQKQQQQQQQQQTPVVATFNNMSLHYRSAPMHSTVHCVGDNYQDNAWIYKSCQFRNLCFDLDEKEYVLFQDPLVEKVLHQNVNDRNHTFSFISSIMTNTTVSIGGINPKWGWKSDGIHRMEWFPKVIPHELEDGYYTFDSDVVWIPFHSLAGHNPGHLLWDDFLPVYTLLTMFDFLDKTLYMTRYTFDDPLWATCDRLEKNQIKCAKMFKKFVPIMRQDPTKFSTRLDAQFKTTTTTTATTKTKTKTTTGKQSQRKSKYVCAPYGAAGIGMLTDHGTKLHGWEPKDFKTTHNHGRGALIKNFRDYLMINAGFTDIQPVNLHPPHKIVFSTDSSQSYTRKMHFKDQMDAVRKAFPKDQVEIEAHTMHKLPLKDQMRIANEAAIFITVCGGGAITAMFLPQGSSLIMYYGESGGISNNRYNGKPAPLDWDFLNNRADVRTHWLSYDNMNAPDHLDSFVDLVRHELDMIHHLKG